MCIKLQPTILALGCEDKDNVFKTGAKWLCTIYSIIKKLRLNGRNVEGGIIIYGTFNGTFNGIFLGA